MGTTFTHDIREQAKPARDTDGRLGGLRLLLAVHVGDERDVDLREVLVANAELELAHRLDERRALDVAHCATELQRSSVRSGAHDEYTRLDDADVRLFARLIDGFLRDAFNPVLNGVRDVRNDLRGRLVRLTRRSRSTA